MGDSLSAVSPTRRGVIGLGVAAAGAVLLAGCTDPEPGDGGISAKVGVTPYPHVDALTALTTLLDAEHRAIFTYTAVTHLVTGAAAPLAAGFAKDHAAHRDALVARIVGLGKAAPAAKATYPLDSQPASAADAVALLAKLEDGQELAYYAALAGSADGALIGFLASVMGAEGQHSAAWRIASGRAPVPVDIVGSPGEVPPQ